MSLRRIAIALAALALSACATSSPPLAAPHDTATAPAAAPDPTAMDSARDIVLAVANPIDPPSTHAGSTLLGYAPPANYGAGQRAASLLAKLKQQYGLREVAGWPVKALGLYCMVLEPPPGVARDALLKALGEDERVKLAQPLQDYAVYGDAPPSSDTRGGTHHYNDPYADLQRGFVETDAARAHQVSQGSGVRVAVVDTGADLTHPDLQGRIADQRNVVDADTAAFNRDAHGTEVAGIIAAIGDNHVGIVGIAPKATLSLYKACWYPDRQAGARCNSFTLAKALAAVLDTDARIVNLSLGGPADPLLGKLLAELLKQGRIVVAALPPDGAVSGFPDNAPGVIVVRSSGAPTHALPDVVAAPGNDILTTQPGGGYDFSSGSSMAAAHVSGILALLLSVAPELDAASAKQLLLASGAMAHGVKQVNAAGAVDALGRMVARRDKAR